MPLDFSNIVDILSNGNRRRQQGQGQGQPSELFRTPGFNPNADKEPRQQNSILAPAIGEPGPYIGKRERPAPWMEQQMQAPTFGGQTQPRVSRWSPKTDMETAPAVPGGMIPVPHRQTNQEEIDQAESAWKQGYKPPSGFGGRLKAALLPLLEGVAKGFATTGDLGGAIGGAGAGFAGGLIAPRRVYEQQFEQKIKPKILERQGREDAEAQAALKAEQTRQEMEYKQAQIRNIGSEIESRKTQAKLERDKFERGPKPPKAPRYVINGNLVDEDGNLIYEGPQKEQDIYSGVEGGILNRRTGDIRENPYGKDRNAPVALTDNKRNSIQNKFNQLHTATTKASQQLAIAQQTLRTYPDDEKAQAAVEKAQINFDAARKSLNDYSSQVGEDFPEDFEGGIGDNDWGFLKPRARKPKAQSRGGQSRAVVDDRFVNFVANKLNISPEQARQRIQSGGYEYQPQQ